MEFRVTHARAFVRSLGLEQYHLMGNSMGAYIAARLALADSEHVARLVLVDSASLAPKGSPESEALARAHSNDLRAYTPSLENIRELSKGTFSDQSNVTEAFVQLRYAMSSGKNWEAQQQRTAVGGAMRPVPPEELGTLRPKTLIVWGADDKGASLEKGVLLFEAIPNAELHVFHGAAHWPQWDQAPRFATLVHDFLTAA
jgi:pimeloyl-ACP methyl ester carboxylesterase